MVSRCFSSAAERFLSLASGPPSVLVSVVATEGSVPREVGTWMGVFADDLVGTIGGGHLEHEAIARARAMLQRDTGKAQAFEPVTVRVALGPSLGQCCGGVMHLRFEAVHASDVPALAQRLASVHRMPVALFGGGHVGHALVQALAPLPVALTWIDSRDGVFPEVVPAQVKCEHSDPVQAAVPGLAPQSRVLIMSFSHAEDLDIVAACLQRQRERGDLPFIGLIGSQTKWASFRKRLGARGFTEAELAQVTCPIGVPGVVGKEPEVIAAAVAAQLLQTRQTAKPINS
ncbi:xanthine dehydrogenase accessory protein XdhC [Polaromonas sp. YR568]|uniref:xanthine dehydrogenase accessory protein XdhC n=1 Tax=Polaromonas sp. YR568 TaxID=1855301 RepID=UPI0031378D93